MTEIYLLRHGESLGNSKRVYLGHADWDLSELGYLQAERAGEALSSVHFDKIYSSDLLRAMHTAEPHARRRGMEIIPCPEIREIALGDWEEMELDVLEKKDEFVHGWRENFGDFRVPGGESVLEAAERVYSAIERIARENDGKRLLLAMHAAVIRAFWCKISGFPTSEWASKVKFPLNTSYSVLKYENGSFIPCEYSNASHLS